MSNKPIRHGEVLLHPISKLTGEATEHTSFIVGHSETGHHHVLLSKKPFRVSQSDKAFLIQLFAPAQLVHQKTVNKHNTLTIAPGVYEVIHKQEYDPFEKVMREVWD